MRLKCCQTVRVEPNAMEQHLWAKQRADQHLKHDHPQAPHIIGCVIHDGCRQAGDGGHELGGAVLGSAVLVQHVLCRHRMTCPISSYSIIVVVSIMIKQVFG